MPRRRAITFLVLLTLLLSAIACSKGKAAVYKTAVELTGGDPHKGRDTIRKYGCNACHTIPGIPGADALVGPPLTKVGSRAYIAGELPNTPANLMRWIQKPQEIEPHTAMPNMGVSEADSRDIAAYLYTLR